MASASSSKHQWPSLFRSLEQRVGGGWRCAARARRAATRRPRCRARARSFAECQHVAFHAALRERPISVGRARQIAAAVKPGADRALDRRRQAGVRPVAGEDQVANSASRAAGRRAASAGVAAKVARRSRTICQRGSAGARPVSVATSRQIVSASCWRGSSISRSAQLIVTESRSGIGEKPLRHAVDYAEDRAAGFSAARCGNAR